MDIPPGFAPDPNYKPDAPAVAAPPAGFTPDYEHYYDKDAVQSRAFTRNKGWAKEGPYQTKLEGQDEQKFRAWFKQNGPNLPPGFDPEDANADYDLRGFYKALKRGDPRARGTVNPYDKRIHLPDVWKTPYHHSFSRESIYATPEAPHWVDNHLLVSKDNKVLWDDKATERENADRELPNSPFNYTPEERAAGTDPFRIIDTGGHGQEMVRDALQPVLGEAGAEEAANAAKSLYKTLPLIGAGLGLGGAVRGGLAARAGEEAVAPTVAEAATPRGPTIQPPAAPAQAPVSPAAAAGENAVVTPPPTAPARPETLVPPARTETPIEPSRPTTPDYREPIRRETTAVPPARPETAIPPSRPTTADYDPATGTYKAPFEAAKPVQAPEAQPAAPKGYISHTEIPAGEPPRMALRNLKTGEIYAAPKYGQAHFQIEPPVPWEDVEPGRADASGWRSGPPIPPPAPKIVPTPPQEAPAPVSEPPPQQIGGMDIQQGDRDFANWLKGDGSKDAGIFSFVNQPNKALAEQRLMNARRFYLSKGGDVTGDDIAKIMRVPKTTGKLIVKALDHFNPPQEKPPTLELSAPTEAEAAPAVAPTEEEDTGPSQAEMEAAGQTSMFGPSPAAPKPTLAPPPEFKPAPEDADKATLYTPASFAAEAHQGTTPMPFKPSNRTFMVPTDQIGLAPEHFQFKIGGDEEGGGLALTGITNWDPDKADPLTLWHDSKGEIGPKGKFYVVNGHQRMGAAKRLGVKEVEARVYDSGHDLQGAARQDVTIPQARARGAMINFGQGRGSELDAATYMRDAGMTEDDLRQEGSVDLSEDKIRTAGGLVNLSPQIWNEVAIGRMEPKVGATIGRELAGDTAKQVQMAKRINEIVEKGGRVNAQQVEDWIKIAKLSPEQVWKQKDLFGEKEVRKNLYEEISSLWQEARSKYGLQTSANRSIAKNKALVEKGATQVDVQTAKQQVALGEKMRENFDDFHALPGSNALKVTRKYAEMLANEPTQAKKIKALYMRDLTPALEEDAKKLNPQAELPKPKEPVPPME